jgi:hypothetical protein
MGGGVSKRKNNGKVNYPTSAKNTKNRQIWGTGASRMIWTVRGFLARLGMTTRDKGKDKGKNRSKCKVNRPTQRKER